MDIVVEVFRWAGIVIAFTLLLLSIWIIKQNPVGNHASLSHHAALKKQSYLAFALFLTFGGALFYGFIAFWIIPQYALESSAYALLVLAYTAQLGLAWTPASISNKKFADFHIFFTIILASAMIIFLIMLSINSTSLPAISSALIPIGTIATFIALFALAFIKKLRNYFLIIELAFITFFCTAMVLLGLNL